MTKYELLDYYIMPSSKALGTIHEHWMNKDYYSLRIKLEELVNSFKHLDNKELISVANNVIEAIKHQVGDLVIARVLHQCVKCMTDYTNYLISQGYSAKAS